MIKITDDGFSNFELVNKMIYELYNDELPLFNRVLNFYQMLLEIIYFDKASVLFFTKNSSGTYDKHSSISINWDMDYVQKNYDEYYCHLDDTLPIMDQPSPVIFKSSDFFNYELRKETAYWKEYLVPNNCIYSMEGNLTLKSSRGIKGGFAFYRGQEKQDFTDDEIRIFKLFQPHLSNIFKYYGEEADSSSIMFMLDKYNSVGLGMLDNNYKIIRANKTFDNILESDNNHGICNKIVQICKSLNSASSNKMTDEYKFDENPIFLEVTRIESPSSSDFQFYCMVYDVSYFFSSTLKQAKEKYTLTQREFDIIQAVLKGKSNEEIAKELYLSLPTVKKYLASIYGKMEIKNQKQIFDRLNLI